MLAHRPGQTVLMDTTPLDVLAYSPATDSTYPIELTVALDVATRSLLAWLLAPLGTKGIDIGVLLADVMTPEPMRPGWDDALRYAMMRLPYTLHAPATMKVHLHRNAYLYVRQSTPPARLEGHDVRGLIWTSR